MKMGRWARIGALCGVGLLSVLSPHHAHADAITDPAVLASVAYWSQAYQVDPNYVERVILCESGGNVDAENPSGASGVLQFMPATFIELQDRLDQDPTLAPALSTYDYDARGLWDEDAQIHVFAWFLYHFGTAGVAQLWSCA